MVEWFDIAGAYRVSMDRRLLASRFVVIKQRSALQRAWLRLTNRRLDASRPNVIAQGLIEADVGGSLSGTPRASSRSATSSSSRGCASWSSGSRATASWSDRS